MFTKSLINGSDLRLKEKELFFPTYERSTFIPAYGKGVYLFDSDHRSFLDLTAGLGVNALGHAHPDIIASINQQLQKYSHLSNGFINEPQVNLAERIRKVSGYSSIFFTNSGTESIEGALKLIRRWGKQNGKKEIYAFSNGFHGRSMGALSLTYKDKYREGYGPFMEEAHHLQFNSLDDLDRINTSTAAVVLEFVLGEGGIRPISKEFAKKLNLLHKKFGFLLVADEIQSGIGRTGKFFSFELFDAKPDIVVCAKPLGGGLPLGCILGSSRVQNIWSYGDHGTTFGGNPVACAAGTVVMDWLIEHGGSHHVNDVSIVLENSLNELRDSFPHLVADVRVLGLMGGIELSVKSAPFTSLALKEGMIINSTDQTVIRLLPPLIITKENIIEMKYKFIRIFEAYGKS